jgi:hypothetical protein
VVDWWWWLLNDFSLKTSFLCLEKIYGFDIIMAHSYLVCLFMILSCLLQVLISGSLESLDIDDLRSNTNYSAGYHPVCDAFLCNKGHGFVTQM